MSNSRIFNSAEFFQATDGEPIRSVVTESPDTVVVAWYIKPNQEIAPHLHPHGQDTWTILQGKGKYYLDQQGTTEAIAAGDIVIAPTGCVHGVFNDGDEPLVFIVIISPKPQETILAILSCGIFLSAHLGLRGKWYSVDTIIGDMVGL